jgi:hypothetical protein
MLWSVFRDQHPAIGQEGHSPRQGKGGDRGHFEGQVRVWRLIARIDLSPGRRRRQSEHQHRIRQFHHHFSFLTSNRLPLFGERDLFKRFEHAVFVDCSLPRGYFSALPVDS